MEKHGILLEKEKTVTQLGRVIAWHSENISNAWVGKQTRGSDGNRLTIGRKLGWRPRLILLFLESASSQHEMRIALNHHKNHKGWLSVDIQIN